MSEESIRQWSVQFVPYLSGSKICNDKLISVLNVTFSLFVYDFATCKTEGKIHNNKNY